MRIYLVTQRKRYVLGRKVFSFVYPTTLDEAMFAIINGFYQVYAPREILITQDFEQRKALPKNWANELAGWFPSRSSPAA